MNLKEYIKIAIQPGKHPDLKLIYEELINFNYKPKEIFDAINEQLTENIEKIIDDYLDKKDYDPLDPDHERDIDEN
jgi:hypothetical protein